MIYKICVIVENSYRLQNIESFLLFKIIQLVKVCHVENLLSVIKGYKLYRFFFSSKQFVVTWTHVFIYKLCVLINLFILNIESRMLKYESCISYFESRTFRISLFGFRIQMRIIPAIPKLCKIIHYIIYPKPFLVTFWFKVVFQKGYLLLSKLTSFIRSFVTVL